MSSLTRPEAGAPVHAPVAAPTSREVRLVARPRGMPVAADFALVSVACPKPVDRQVLVRNLFMSVDPYMRGRMNDGASYVPPFGLDAPLSGGAVGEVVTSLSPEFQPGDVVTSSFGWREWFVGEPAELHHVDAATQPLSLHLGALGMTGLTAWAGIRLAKLQAGETLFVSGAAGAVGSIAGQLAKLHGCHVVGSTGSVEKVRFLLDECGFDAAFDHHDGDIGVQLERLLPDGVDVYFDNVGGAALEAALAHMRLYGRIIACGGIANYNQERPVPGPANLANLITRRLTMRGLIVGDWLDHRAEFERVVGGYLRNGSMKSRETVVTGIEHAVEAFLGLFDGRNTGKMIVRLG